MRLYDGNEDPREVGFEDAPPRFPGVRYDLVCADCGSPMVLREGKFGLFYGCVKFPACKGSLTAKKDGSPLGTPADKNTRKSRVQAHYVFDQIWKEKLPDPSYIKEVVVPGRWLERKSAQEMNRHKAYKWMRKAMELPMSKAHISMFDTELCEKLISLVYRDFPRLKDAWARVMHDDIFGEDD